MAITRDDYARVSAAIHAAEARTSAQLICVMARSASTYSFIPLTWAALVALAVPLPLILLTFWSVQLIYLAQLVSFLVLGLVLSLPALRLYLVPRAVQRRRAHRAAMEQFMIRGLSRTHDRTGVLIFMSVAERYVRVSADDGIVAKVPNAAWQGVVDHLVTHARTGDYAEGFVHALQECGDILSAPFPTTPNADNELPDRLYVI